MAEDYSFSCQLLRVWAKDPAKGAVLENARTQQLGARSFIVGELAFREGAPDARAGLTYWIPVDEVLTLTEYPDRARLDATQLEWDEHRAKKASKRRWPFGG